MTLGNLVQAYDGTAKNVSATTAPPGLTVDVTYSGLTNAPANPGSYSVIGTIDDPNYQGSATGTLVITLPPTITAGPTNQVVPKGGTLTLSLTAGGFPSPAYQWFKDSRRMLGATNSTLTVTNADVTCSGTYYVVVTNVGGMAISLPALVAVGNPSLLAWGNNKDGQFGNGTNNYYADPTPVSVASNVVAGVAGAAHSLFLKTDGMLWAMGWNVFGQLGNGDQTGTNVFTPASVASNVVAVAAGYGHSLYVMTNGTLWAMGYNAYGQLGNGTTNNASRPIIVASNVVAGAAGAAHSLFLKTDGTLWAMGFNNVGQLGNGTISDYWVANSTPISVASNVVAVAAGDSHSLFVKTDGTLWAMGDNWYGQLGNGTSGNKYSQPINVASNVLAVAAGGVHSLFVKTNGTLWVMGRNFFGQLGNGDSTGSNVLSAECVASNVVAVAAGEYHSLFVKANGTPWAMGDNGSGQLGNGTTSNTNLPVIVPHLFVANVFPANSAFHSLAIGIIQATVTLGNLDQIYSGSAISVTASTTPPGLTVNLTYNGSSTAPTNAGSYTVIANVSVPGYQGSATNTLVVGKAATITTLTNVTADFLSPVQSLTATYVVSPLPPGGGTPTGMVTLTNELSAVSGPAPAGTVTMVLTNVGTFHFAATYSGDANFLPSSSSPSVSRTVLSLTNPAAWSAGSMISKGTRFLQTSLMQQLLALTNVTSQTLAAVRVTIHLSAFEKSKNIIVYNASGTNGAGEPYLQYNYPLPPGDHVTFTAEYYSPDRVTVPNPTFTVELVTPETLVVPPGTPQALLRPPVVLAPDNAFLIDFLTVKGATYFILYSKDMVNWSVAQPAVAGTGYDVQWVDDGPPKTESPPGNVPHRFYQVLKAN
jgi:alpha-tubulin suppressor-like RCC1 family protein